MFYGPCKNPLVTLPACLMYGQSVNLLRTNPTKWSSALKQFVGNLPTKCFSVFDHFVGLALKGLRSFFT